MESTTHEPRRGSGCDVITSDAKVRYLFGGGM